MIVDAAQPGVALTGRGAQTRLKILEAAASLIADQGVTGTTLEHVKTAATVSSSQLYHYFADKQALVHAVIEYQTQAMIIDQSQCDFRSIAGFRAWRNHLVDHERELDCKGGCPLGSLGSELAESDPTARAEVSAGLDRWKDMIGAGLRSMLASGLISPAIDPDELAQALLAALQGGLLLSQLQRDTRPLEVAIDHFISYLEMLAPGTPGQAKVKAPPQIGKRRSAAPS